MRVNQAIALMLLTAQLSACTGWHRPPLPLAPDASFDRARVTMLDGQRVELVRVRMDGERLIGTPRDTPDLVDSWSVPVERVARMERRGFSPWRTAWLSLGIVGGVAVLGAATIVVVCVAGGCGIGG